MKNLAKRLLAITLTLVMALSVFAIPTAVNAADETVTIDFESDTYKTQLNGSGDALFTTVDDNDGKALKYAGTWAAHKEMQVQGIAPTDTVTMTGDFKFGSVFAGNYSGFQFSPIYNATTTGGQIFTVMLKAADKITVSTSKPSPGYGATTDVQLSYTVGDWWSYEMVRNGRFLGMTVWKKGTEKPADYTMSLVLPSTAPASYPGMRITNFNGANAASAGNSITEIYLDNLVITNKSNAVWSGVSETFENQTAGSFDAAKMAVTGYAEGSAPTIVEENGNKYFSFTGISKYSFSPKMSMASYTINAEMKFTHDATSSSTANGLYFMDGATTIQLFHNESTKGLVEGGGKKLTNVFNDTDWYNFEAVRIDKALTITMWVKGTEKPATPTLSVELASAEPTIPVLRFARFKNANTTTYVDNLTFASTVSPANNVAYQASVEEANDTTDTKFAVRFIATLDSLYYSDVRFRVTAKYNDGTADKVKQFVTPDHACVAYTEIIANENNNIVAYDASALGGDADDYLIALNINEIPKAYGTVEFYVEVYVKNAQGITVTDAYSVVATVAADNTVTMALK